MSNHQKAKASLMGDQARKIVITMKPEWVFQMRIVALDTGLSVTAVRQKMKFLRNLGLVDLGPIYNEDDGLIYGSGYSLTCEGEAMREFLLADPA